MSRPAFFLDRLALCFSRLALALALLIASTASARTVIQIPTESDSGVHIQIESCFSELPSGGYAPLDVTINNSSGRARTWKLEFVSPAWNFIYPTAEIAEKINFNSQVTVEAGATRTFRLLAPLSTSDQASTLSAGVSGYGVPNGAQQFFPTGPRSGKTLTPCMAVSEGAAAQLGKHLEDAANGGSRQLYTASCRTDELPDDWRALAGFAGIWLLDSEWGALSASQRTALEDWLATGGRLFLCSKNPAPPPRRKGLGSIVSVDLRSLDQSATRSQWSEMIRGDLPSIVNDDLTHWDSAQAVGVLKPNLPLLIGFLSIFATIIGPVNLFVLAREGRRSRLYWTVPVISLGATALLLLLIIVQDGFGGWGVRSAVICLVPSARKAVIFQEQISRTGVLGSTAFSLRDPAWVTMVNLGKAGRSGRKVPSVQNADIRFDEEWFRSRALQSQWIESIIPTRAEVALVNRDEARDGLARPEIISSIAVPLSDFCFWDAKGHCWRATNVRTGVKTVLSEGAALTGYLAEARVPLRRRAAGVEGVPGNFVAISDDGAAFVATLPAIRWKNLKAIYIGPVTGAEDHP